MPQPPTVYLGDDLARLKADWIRLAQALRSVLKDTDVASLKTEDYLAGDEKVTREALRAALDQAWETSKKSREVLRSATESLRAFDAVNAAYAQLLQTVREMIQADNATMAGRDGCEKRWDAAVKALRATANTFRD